MKRDRVIRFVLLLVALLSANVLAAAPGIRLELVTKGLSKPVDFTNDGKRLFVVEQPGKIRLIENGKAIDPPFLDISDHVTHQGECGLLGLAFHPEFEKNGYFYVNYTTGWRKTLKTVVAEFKAEPGATKVDPKTERAVIEIPQPYNNHNGGQVVFGPDGMLYIGMGDGGAANDPQNRAQNPQELHGKILRIDVNDRSPYGIPKDNPFIDDNRFKPEIWCWGIRNAWRLSFDRKTGVCYCGDIGQNKYEEIDVIVKGGNYGWRLREAGHTFMNEPGEKNLIEPIAEYGRDKGASVTGGFVYRGKKYPKLEGVYIYADYVSGRFWGLRYEKGKVLANEELKVSVDGKPALNRVQPSSFGEDVEGEIYVCDHERGNVYRLVGE